MKKTPEDYVKDDIENYLDTLDNCWRDTRQAGGFSYKKGLPDIYGCYYGYHFEIEVKKINLSDEVRMSVTNAQARQIMINSY